MKQNLCKKNLLNVLIIKFSELRQKAKLLISGALFIGNLFHPLI
jgi:hypothetical protein